MNSATIATTLALVLAVYLAVTDWIDLAPWNKVDDLPIRQKLLVSIANYTPLVVIAFAISQPNSILIVVALVIGGIDLLMHVAYWWLPYLRGANAAHRAEHARMFDGTTSFLPAISDHPVPNAQHVVVGILMLGMVVATGATAISAL